MSLVDRVRGVLLSPGTALPAFAAEPASVPSLYAGYIAPLAAIPAIASFIGLSIVGVTIPFVGTFRYPIVGGVANAVVSFVFALVGIFVFALVIDQLAPNFGATRDPVAALKTAAVAATPGWVVGVLGILPALGILVLLAALYGLYLLYIGLPIFMRAPRERAGGYAVVAIVLAIVIYIVIAIFLGVVRNVLPGNPASVASLSGAVAGSAIAQRAIDAANAVASAAAQASPGTNPSQGEAGSSAGAANGSSPASAGSATGSGVDAAKAGAAVGAMVGGMISGGRTGQKIVDFHELEGVFASSAGGLSRTNLSGDSTTMQNIAVSKATATYGGSGGNVTVEVSDMANASGILAMMGLASAVQHESDTGFDKNETLGGLDVHEHWESSGKQSELIATVNKRFLIDVKGSGVDFDAAKAALGAVDVPKLQTLGG